jgi:hypothetical protein
MKRLPLLCRLALLYLGCSALGVTAPVWLLALFVWFIWRRVRERMSAWRMASLQPL